MRKVEYKKGKPLEGKRDTERRNEFLQSLELIQSSFGFSVCEAFKDGVIEGLESGKEHIFLVKNRKTGTVASFHLGWKGENDGHAEFYGHLMGTDPALAGLGLTGQLMDDLMINRIHEYGNYYRGAVNPFGYEVKHFFDMGMTCPAMIARDKSKTDEIKYYGEIPAKRLFVNLSKDNYQARKQEKAECKARGEVWGENNLAKFSNLRIIEDKNASLDSVVGACANKPDAVALTLSREKTKFDHLGEDRKKFLEVESNHFYENAVYLFSLGYEMTIVNVTDKNDYQYIFTSKLPLSSDYNGSVKSDTKIEILRYN